MRRLWGRASSSNVQKALWALDELGLPFEHRVVGGPHGGLDDPEFAALTPLRRVPVLQEDGVTVWESHAILRHLDRVHPGPLSPQGVAQAAAADQWLDFAANTWQPPMIALFWQLVRLPTARRDPANMAPALAELDAATAILDARLAQSEWLAGERFTLADIATGAQVFRYHDLPIPRPERPGLARWYAALQRRPGFLNRVMTSYEELRAPD